MWKPATGYRYRIPRDESRGMRTDVVVYASEALMAQIRKDLSLEQAINVATLPGIVGPSLAMPDIHQGYGFPIGGVAAMDWENGVVSPGGVGFDINCGVRLVRTTLQEQDVRPKLRELINQVFRDVPCGTGGSGFIKIGARDLDRILVEGARWMVKNGYGEERDAEFAEAGGALEGADPKAVSERAQGTRAAADRNPRKRKSFPRGAVRGEGARRGSGTGLRDLARPGGGADPFRLARAGPPGVHGLRGAHEPHDAEARHPTGGSSTGLRADPVGGREAVPGRDVRGGQLRVGQPPGHPAFPARSVPANFRRQRAARPDLRRLPQHRQAGAVRDRRAQARCAGPSQGRDPRIPARTPRDTRRLPRRRSAGLRSGKHGDCFVGAGRAARAPCARPLAACVMGRDGC